MASFIVLARATERLLNPGRLGSSYFAVVGVAWRQTAYGRCAAARCRLRRSARAIVCQLALLPCRVRTSRFTDRGQSNREDRGEGGEISMIDLL